MVQDRTDLLTLRARQLIQREVDLEEAVARLKRMRNRSKEYADDARGAEDRIHDIEALLLPLNSRYNGDDSVSRKLAY